ncbi:hypothetical protein [Frankia sp. CcI49]|uniref:hypothetical protein n=1 Tax=Frankia sp. CcI49 TaxID=1745382 RepID=UPI0010542B7D|nr:hypothetical protein [Frankia sp. CcI49]
MHSPVTGTFPSDLLWPARDRSAPPPPVEIANAREGAEEHLGPTSGTVWHVDCRGTPHLIVLVDGLPVALDHGPAELRRERLLAELTGAPLPCVRVLDQALRLTVPADGVPGDPQDAAPDGVDLFGAAPHTSLPRPATWRVTGRSWPSSAHGRPNRPDRRARRAHARPSR